MTASPVARGRRALVDSSAFLALVNPHDKHHFEARIVLEKLREDRWSTFTTNFFIAEAHSLFLARLGRIHAAEFLRQIVGGSTVIVRPDLRDEEKAREIVFKYDDKDFSLTDALSFVVMERMAISHSFTFDQHFGQFGLAVLKGD